MSKVHAAHDHLFKLLLELPGVARALLSERLPAPLRERLEGEEPQPVPGDFIRRGLNEIRSGLVFRQRLCGGQACLYALIEHKSGRDDAVGFQLLGYLSAGWRDLRGQSEELGCEPLIVPLVVYHGVPEWSLPCRFSDGLPVDDELRPLLLDFPIEVFDVGRGDEMKLSSHPWLRGGLRLLRHGVRAVPREEKRALLVSVLTDLRGVPDYFLQASANYILNRWVPVSRKDLSRALRVAMPDKEAVVISKAAQEFIKEGERRGVRKGRKEATLGTEAKILLLQLSQKFGPVPEGVEKRVRVAALGQLETWLDRFVEAKTMEDVFS
jgi:predicted transposase YdaD